MTDQEIVAIISAEVLREKWRDDSDEDLLRAGVVPTLTEEQVKRLEALPDNELTLALNDSLGDFFWEVFNKVLDDATHQLLEEM